MKTIRTLAALAALCAATLLASAEEQAATAEQMQEILGAALELSKQATATIEEGQALAAEVAVIKEQVAQLVETKRRLEAENAGLRAALEAKVGKSHAQLIADANAANIRMARAEGDLAKLRAQIKSDPFAPGVFDAGAPSASADPFAPAPTVAKPKSWQTVQILQGTGNKRGPKFTVWGEWRAHWQYTSGEMAFFSASIEGDDPDDYQRLANTSESGKDVTMGKGVGELTLDVSALDGSWAVKIEELR